MLDGERQKIYYRLLFKMLRLDGELERYKNHRGINCRKGESVVDALVRSGVAPDPWAAVEMVAAAAMSDPRPFAREIAAI